MEQQLHETFQKVIFTEEVREMFLQILKQDQPLFEVFRYIAKTSEANRRSENAHKGVIIQDIMDNVIIERSVGIKRGNTLKFERNITNIDRRAAEKCVDMLSAMSLIHFEVLKPYKFIHMTSRGKQVFAAYVKERRTEQQEQANQKNE